MRRYAKPIVVADDLTLLRGRTTGVVTLPRHLDWSGAADYDLDSPGRIVDLYRTVLIEAERFRAPKFPMYLSDGSVY